MLFKLLWESINDKGPGRIGYIPYYLIDKPWISKEPQCPFENV